MFALMLSIPFSQLARNVSYIGPFSILSYFALMFDIFVCKERFLGLQRQALHLQHLLLLV